MADSNGGMSETEFASLAPPKSPPTSLPMTNTGAMSEDQFAQSIPPQPSPVQQQGAMSEAQFASSGQTTSTDPTSDFSPVSKSMMKEFTGGLDLTVKPESLVGKTMQTLAIPLRAETSTVMKAAQLLGVPGASEWNQKYNPEGKVLPNAYVSDISDFYIDKAAQSAGVPQIPGALGGITRAAVTSAKFGIGLGANILADPLTGLKLGQLTPEAAEIQKMGGKLTNAADVAKGAEPIIDPSALRGAGQEKNLLTYKVPLTDAQVSIKGQPVQDAMSMIASNPVVKTVASWVKTLSPDTGDPVIDSAMRAHDNLTRGDPVDVANRYMGPKQALNMTSDEDRIASALVEATPNLKPDIPQEHLTAAELRTSKTNLGTPAVRNPDFWADEPTIRQRMAEKIQKVANGLGIEVAPGRDAAIIDAGLLAKKAGAENLMDKFHAGVLTPENIAQKTLDNHLPHVMDPSYQGVKDLKEYEAKVASDEAEVNRTSQGTWVSSKDITRRREVTGTLEQANTAMKDQKGLSNWFITDPVAAGTARLIESKKLLRDSQLLDSIKDFGSPITRAEAVKSGRVSIDHPELEGRRVALPNSSDSTNLGRVVQYRDLYYPPEVASKVQYRLARPALTGAQAALANYNRVFRSAIFMSSPGIRFGNALDNVLKTMAVTGKNFIQASKDAYGVLMDKSSGFRSDPTPLRPNGVFYDGKTLKSLVNKFGLTKTGAWAEGMDPFLKAGKQMSLGDAMERPGAMLPKYAWGKAKAMVKAVDTFGESGENTARVALFLDRLRQGFEPEQAANEVTKWLFDYNRNSPAMENVRMAMPFLQHPLKTAFITPQLVGAAPGLYNFIQNSGPHVIANAFHDPVTQAELNTILPPGIKQRDGIAGPFIPGNTWMSAVFGSQNPKLGSMGWFDPRIGLRILNHFDYFSKGGTDHFLGETSPVIQGLIGMMGRGDFGKSLDYANGNVNIANRASYALSKIIGGVSPFPNAEKMIMQAFGLVDPKHVEPNSVLIMKGLAGQFGGITDLDRDVQSKLLSAHYAFMDQKKQLISAVRQEIGSSMSPGSLGKYVKGAYGSITGTTPADVHFQMTKSMQDQGESQLGAQALGGGMTAGDFAARMKGLAEDMKRINFNYQALGARKLQMAREPK